MGSLFFGSIIKIDLKYLNLPALKTRNQSCRARYFQILNDEQTICPFTGGERKYMNRHTSSKKQNILVFQQNGSGESKLKGIRKYGGELFDIKTVDIDIPLPPVIDDTDEYLPGNFQADLVLDFLKHPDLSYDLAAKCSEKDIPAVASGKKIKIRGVHTPPI